MVIQGLSRALPRCITKSEQQTKFYEVFCCRLIPTNGKIMQFEEKNDERASPPTIYLSIKPMAAGNRSDLFDEGLFETCLN